MPEASGPDRFLWACRNCGTVYYTPITKQCPHCGTWKAGRKKPLRSNDGE